MKQLRLIVNLMQNAKSFRDKDFRAEFAIYFYLQLVILIVKLKWSSILWRYFLREQQQANFFVKHDWASKEIMQILNELISEHNSLISSVYPHSMRGSFR